MIRKTCHFSGRVQGVGFRFTTQSLARNFAVAGYVQNLSDGRVKLVVEAEEAEIARFLDELHRELGRYVRDVAELVETATGEFNAFSVRL